MITLRWLFTKGNRVVQRKKRLRLTLALSLLSSVIITGTAVCSAGQLRTLAPVGPSEPEHAGYLIVYSATVPFDDGDVIYYTHTSYNLYTAQGAFLKRIRNRIMRGDEAPETVKLAPGRYVIHAQSEMDGPVAVPVIIADGRTTVVNLENDRRGRERRTARR